MNFSNLSSSFIPSNTDPSLFEFTHSMNTSASFPINQDSSEFVPKTKSFIYVVGEQLTNLASFFYSRLPSLSLPGAHASPTDPRHVSATCSTPKGSYESSCNKPEVTYLPGEDLCLLKTRCETIYEGLPHKLTNVTFSPKQAPIVLENINGTLVIQPSCEVKLDPELDKVSEMIRTKEVVLDVIPDPIISTLTVGNVITLNKDLQSMVIPSTDWEKKSAPFKAFQRIASATGGIMGHSPTSESSIPLIEKIFTHILATAKPNEPIDIAFVIDTTYSMKKYIEKVRDHLVKSLRRLQEKKGTNVNVVRFALLEYRDGDIDSKFLNNVNINFTQNLKQVEQAIQNLKVQGGDDDPEAVLDALLAAKQKLSWNSEAKQIVILIGDADPHPKTKTGITEDAVMAQYQTTGTQIAVYPLLANN